MRTDLEQFLEKRKGQRLNILIVDDEDNVRDVFRDFCNSSPLFQVETAPGGREAITLVEKKDYDIVTVDLVMPEMSGLDAIEKIKRRKPHLPVVIITGNATEELIRQAGQLGGCRVLHKPVGIDEFLDEIVDLAQEKC